MPAFKISAPFELRALSDVANALLLGTEGTKTYLAAVAIFNPLLANALASNPTIGPMIASAIATQAPIVVQAALDDSGVARGVVPVAEQMVAGHVDADGRPADDAIGPNGRFFPHTIQHISEAQGVVQIPAGLMIAGHLDANNVPADDAIGPDGMFLQQNVDRLRIRMGAASAADTFVNRAVTGWGDSLMETVGTDFINLLGINLGVPAHNAGKSGMRMEHIALGAGGLRVHFDFPGDSLPGTVGPHTLTRVAPARGSNAFSIGSNDYVWHGYFLGASGQRVDGFLTQRTGTGGWDFTRYTAGSAVPMKRGAGFVPSAPEALRRTLTIFDGGRNNPYAVEEGSWAYVAADLNAAVQSLGHNRFVVFTITTRYISAERTGEPQRLLIDAENNRRLAKWPNNCFDLNRWMHENAVAYLGLPADAQDAIDTGQGWIPKRLYNGNAATDQTHFKPEVYQAWAQITADFITTKGLLP
ncbi:hypothetical protein SCB71_14360 [Herbiconiux sp. KACC 21604]|uniref:hypothetical protein n=1 Tax=unclassified Herbiconiux TaxID=2618217 RepID=UPI0014918D92|nr:hypothetical protein [Herbiconiux sp. SALV-R1]QJU54325.1 hypothetical protein HL652_12300 [Herbiconiux sp. SALV-R1]WPO85395.1 hypothetical protein SCB71_14360 [Herbiconiux sp. KACC 21604]